jgi:hypothetical protein
MSIRQHGSEFDRITGFTGLISRGWKKWRLDFPNLGNRSADSVSILSIL